MLIDELMPTYDAARAEHRIVAGDVAAVYTATRRADFMQAWRASATVRMLFAARGLAERAVSLITRREYREPPPLDALRLADMPRHGDWVLLGEDPPAEIAFGVIGRFWAGETVWRESDAADFKVFAEPGLGKIACSFSLRPYGADRTLVTYECRTLATDANARRSFMRYWRAVAPFIGLVMRSQLRVIDDEAAGEQHRSPYPTDQRMRPSAVRRMSSHASANDAPTAAPATPSALISAGTSSGRSASASPRSTGACSMKAA